MEGTAHQENIQHFSPFTGSYASFPCLGLLGAANKLPTLITSPHRHSLSVQHPLPPPSPRLLPCKVGIRSRI